MLLMLLAGLVFSAFALALIAWTIELFVGHYRVGRDFRAKFNVPTRREARRARGSAADGR